MRKMNNKGFTLIELLAVITIMGILMMVAIPAVSKTIENSRRDTFANLAQKYLENVRTSVLADELMCEATAGSGSYTLNVAATPDATYYFKINTSTTAATEIKQQTEDLMESGGKSPWGNADVEGYVKWVRTTRTIGTGANVKTNTKTTYSVMLTDTAKHGTTRAIEDQKIKRQSIAVSGATAAASPTETDVFECILG